MECGSKVFPTNQTDNSISLEVHTRCSIHGQNEDTCNVNRPSAAVWIWDKDRCKPKRALLVETLKPLFLWLSVCGLTWNPYCTNTSRRSSRIVRRCYSIFVLVLFLQQLAISTLCYTRHNTDREIALIITTQLSFVLVIFIWFCGLVFPKRITAFVIKFDHVRSCARHSAPTSNIEKILNIATLASVSSIVILTISLYGTGIAGLYKPELACFSNPIENQVILSHFMLVIVPVTSALMLLVKHVVLIFFVTVCILLKREFDACSEGLKEMTTQRADEDVLEVFGKHHGDLWHLTEMTGSFLSVYVGGVYVYSVMIVCLAIYICMFSDNVFTLNTSCILLYLAVLHLVLVTYFGMKLHNAAHAPLKIFHDLEGRTLNDRVIGLVILLTNKLYQNEIGISVMGLMIITKSTVFTIIGTLLTYIFIVIQFKPSSASPLVPPGNSTVLP